MQRLHGATTVAVDDSRMHPSIIEPRPANNLQDACQRKVQYDDQPIHGTWGILLFIEQGNIRVGVGRRMRRAQWVADHCPYQYYFKNVDYRFDDGVLTLRGRVPTFYLKQILQAVLGQLPHVERIENRVEVVSSVGLSSAAAK